MPVRFESPAGVRTARPMRRSFSASWSLPGAHAVSSDDFERCRQPGRTLRQAVGGLKVLLIDVRPGLRDIFVWRLISPKKRPEETFSREANRHASTANRI